MRALAILLVGLAVPAIALGQTPPPPDAPPVQAAPPPPPIVPAPSYPEPAPPTYPPLNPVPQQAAPQPPPNLQPYAPINLAPAQASSSQHEFGLASAEFFASAGVTIAATIAVASAIGNQNTAGEQATAQIAALLYLGLIPAVSSLPVWLIGLVSDAYEPHIGPAIEAGETVSGIAFIIFLIADQTEPNNTTSSWKYVAGGLILIGMPLAEVIALNVTKTPKGMPYYGLAPVLPEAPSSRADVGLPEPGTIVLAGPSLSF